MKVIETLNKLSLFIRLVEQESTGTPTEFANRLGISKTSLYDLIDELRSHNIKIVYSRSRKTFYNASSIPIRIENIIKNSPDTIIPEIQS